MSLKRQMGHEEKAGKTAARFGAEAKPHYPAAARARVHSAEYFRTLIESATDGVAVVLPDGAVQYHNPSLIALLGFPSRELYATNLFDLIHPDDLPPVRPVFSQEESDGSLGALMQFRMKHKSRGWRIVECRLTNLLAKESVHGLVLGLKDITERVLADREINENRAQLRSLAMALTMAEEKQRKELATQLHDSIGQALALANMKLGAAVSAAASEEETARINEVRDLIRDMIQTTRTLTFNLSPPILYTVGLEAAVEWLGKRLRAEHGIDFTLHSFGTQQSVGEDLRVLLFHVVRELLFNIVKHARAGSVKVSVSGGEDSISIVVEDDGVGFDTGVLLRRRTDAGGFGLFSIHERLTHVGGRFEIHSAAGQGTTVSFSVPFNTQREGAGGNGSQNSIGG